MNASPRGLGLLAAATSVFATTACLTNKAVSDCSAGHLQEALPLGAFHAPRAVHVHREVGAVHLRAIVIGEWRPTGGKSPALAKSPTKTPRIRELIWELGGS